MTQPAWQPAVSGSQASPDARPVPPATAGALVLTVIAGVWAVGVTIVLQPVGWLVDQLLLLLGLDRAWWLWLVVSPLNAGIVAVPALLVTVLVRHPAVRATGRAWLAGSLCAGLLGMVRVVPSPEPELYLAVLAATALILRFVLATTPWWRREPGARSGTWPVGLAAGLVILLPWLWFGALGGALETVLAVAAAVALGWLAATILGPRFWTEFGGSRLRQVLLGGLAGGVALLLIGAGAGASGAQLPLLMILPPLAFLAARTRAVGWLVALGALGPLALVDPEELTLLLTGRDVPFWAIIATASSLGLALLVGLAAALAPAPGRPPARRWVAVVGAGVMVVAGAAVYAGLGQPGLHGERLFVIMADQADLSGMGTDTGQAGRDARAAEVYQRLVTHAEQSQAGLRADLDRLRLPYTPYYLVNAVEVAGGPEVRAWLAGRPDVDRVLRSQRLRPVPALGPPDEGTETPDDPEWNIVLIGADRVWQELGVTGAGIVVGSSDSGVDGSHPALAEGYRGGDDSWLDPWNHTATPTDRGGHGTHTLGTAVGRGGIGVAPDAQWTACVNLERNLGNPALYLDCLQFMLAPYPRGGDPFRDGRPDRAPHVLTNSWGCPPIEGCDLTSLAPATAALHAAGIYMVAAAGNTGPFCGSITDPPAPYSDVLTVGAVDRNEQVTEFSSRGPDPDPDLVAPGMNVVSAMPGGGYQANSGTSMAGPHGAGVVALMWSANPELIGDVATTTRILRETARPLPEPDRVICGGFEALAGAGLIDAHAAVLAAQAA